MSFHLQTRRPARKVLCAVIAFFFIFNILGQPAVLYAQTLAMGPLTLPAPGMMVPASPGFAPLVIKAVTINPNNPLQFDFIMDTGDSGLKGQKLEDESTRLIKYFLAAITVPEDDLWVNLSPHEKDRIIPETFGQTEMGRDLLAQDYILKQMTASLMYPEDDLGKKFWKKVRAKAKSEYGISKIPHETINKVWIMPKKAVVYEHEGSAFVLDRELKVMLEQDYLALAEGARSRGVQTEERSAAMTEMIRELLVPEIEKEVNQGKNFAPLRQIYHSMILASWYKDALKESLLNRVYADQNKIKGIDIADKEAKEKIYAQYLKAFKKGVYNYIKKDIDEQTGETKHRKYFSGGAAMSIGKMRKDVDVDPDKLPVKDRALLIQGASEHSRNFRMTALFVENANEASATAAEEFAEKPGDRAMLTVELVNKAAKEELQEEVLDRLKEMERILKVGKKLWDGVAEERNYVWKTTMEPAKRGDDELKQYYAAYEKRRVSLHLFFSLDQEIEQSDDPNLDYAKILVLRTIKKHLDKKLLLFSWPEQLTSDTDKLIEEVRRLIRVVDYLMSPEMKPKESPNGSRYLIVPEKVVWPKLNLNKDSAMLSDALTSKARKQGMFEFKLPKIGGEEKAVVKRLKKQIKHYEKSDDLINFYITLLMHSSEVPLRQQKYLFERMDAIKWFAKENDVFLPSRDGLPGFRVLPSYVLKEKALQEGMFAFKLPEIGGEEKAAVKRLKKQVLYYQKSNDLINFYITLLMHSSEVPLRQQQYLLKRIDAIKQFAKENEIFLPSRDGSPGDHAMLTNVDVRDAAGEKDIDEAFSQVRLMEEFLKRLEQGEAADQKKWLKRLENIREILGQHMSNLKKEHAERKARSKDSPANMARYIVRNTIQQYLTNSEFMWELFDPSKENITEHRKSASRMKGIIGFLMTMDDVPEIEEGIFVLPEEVLQMPSSDSAMLGWEMDEEALTQGLFDPFLPKNRRRSPDNVEKLIETAEMHQQANNLLLFYKTLLKLSKEVQGEQLYYIVDRLKDIEGFAKKNEILLPTLDRLPSDRAMLSMSNRIENALEKLERWENAKGYVTAFPKGASIVLVASTPEKLRETWLIFIQDKIDRAEKYLEMYLESQKKQEEEAPFAADRNIKALKAMAVKDPQFSKINKVIGSKAQHEILKGYDDIKKELETLRRGLYKHKVNIFVSGLAQRVSLADARSIILMNTGERTLHTIEYPDNSINVVLKLARPQSVQAMLTAKTVHALTNNGHFVLEQVDKTGESLTYSFRFILRDKGHSYLDIEMMKNGATSHHFMYVGVLKVEGNKVKLLRWDNTLDVKTRKALVKKIPDILAEQVDWSLTTGRVQRIVEGITRPFKMFKKGAADQAMLTAETVHALTSSGYFALVDQDDDGTGKTSSFLIQFSPTKGGGGVPFTSVGRLQVEGLKVKLLEWKDSLDDNTKKAMVDKIRDILPKQADLILTPASVRWIYEEITVVLDEKPLKALAEFEEPGEPDMNIKSVFLLASWASREGFDLKKTAVLQALRKDFEIIKKAEQASSKGGADRAMLTTSYQIENARKKLKELQDVKAIVNASNVEGDASIELDLGSGAVEKKTKAEWLPIINKKVEQEKKNLSGFLEAQKRQEQENPTSADKDIRTFQALVDSNSDFSDDKEVRSIAGVKNERWQGYDEVNKRLRALREELDGRKVNIFVSGFWKRVSLAAALFENLRNAGERTLHVFEYPDKSMNVVLEIESLQSDRSMLIAEPKTVILRGTGITEEIIIGGALEKAGYRVLHAKSAKDVSVFLENEQVDVVVTNYVLSGYENAYDTKEAVEKSRTPDLPIIAVAVLKDFLETENDGFVVKMKQSSQWDGDGPNVLKQVEKIIGPAVDSDRAMLAAETVHALTERVLDLELMDDGTGKTIPHLVKFSPTFSPEDGGVYFLDIAMKKKSPISNLASVGKLQVEGQEVMFLKWGDSLDEKTREALVKLIQSKLPEKARLILTPASVRRIYDDFIERFGDDPLETLKALEKEKIEDSVTDSASIAFFLLVVEDDYGLNLDHPGVLQALKKGFEFIKFTRESKGIAPTKGDPDQVILIAQKNLATVLKSFQGLVSYLRGQYYEFGTTVRSLGDGFSGQFEVKVKVGIQGEPNKFLVARFNVSAEGISELSFAPVEKMRAKYEKPKIFEGVEDKITEVLNKVVPAKVEDRAVVPLEVAQKIYDDYTGRFGDDPLEALKALNKEKNEGSVTDNASIAFLLLMVEDYYEFKLEDRAVREDLQMKFEFIRKAENASQKGEADHAMLTAGSLREERIIRSGDENISSREFMRALARAKRVVAREVYSHFVGLKKETGYEDVVVLDARQIGQGSGALNVMAWLARRYQGSHPDVEVFQGELTVPADTISGKDRVKVFVVGLGLKERGNDRVQEARSFYEWAERLEDAYLSNWMAVPVPNKGTAAQEKIFDLGAQGQVKIIYSVREDGDFLVENQYILSMPFAQSESEGEEKAITGVVSRQELDSVLNYLDVMAEQIKWARMKRETRGEKILVERFREKYTHIQKTLALSGPNSYVEVNNRPQKARIALHAALIIMDNIDRLGQMKSGFIANVFSQPAWVMQELSIGEGYLPEGGQVFGGERRMIEDIIEELAQQHGLRLKEQWTLRNEFGISYSLRGLSPRGFFLTEEDMGKTLMILKEELRALVWEILLEIKREDVGIVFSPAGIQQSLFVKEVSVNKKGALDWTEAGSYPSGFDSVQARSGLAMLTTSFKDLPEGVTVDDLLIQASMEKKFAISKGQMESLLFVDKEGYSQVMLDNDGKLHAFILVEKAGDDGATLVVRRYGSEVSENMQEYIDDLFGMLAALGEQVEDQGVARIDWEPLSIRLGYDKRTQASPAWLADNFWHLNILDINQPVNTPSSKLRLTDSAMLSEKDVLALYKGMKVIGIVDPVEFLVAYLDKGEDSIEAVNFSLLLASLFGIGLDDRAFLKELLGMFKDIRDHNKDITEEDSGPTLGSGAVYTEDDKRSSDHILSESKIPGSDQAMLTDVISRGDELDIYSEFNPGTRMTTHLVRYRVRAEMRFRQDVIREHGNQSLAGQDKQTAKEVLLKTKILKRIEEAKQSGEVLIDHAMLGEDDVNDFYETLKDMEVDPLKALKAYKDGDVMSDEGAAFVSVAADLEIDINDDDIMQELKEGFESIVHGDIDAEDDLSAIEVPFEEDGDMDDLSLSPDDHAMLTTSFKNLPEGVTVDDLLKQASMEEAFNIDKWQMKSWLRADEEGYSQVILNSDDTLHAFILVEKAGVDGATLVVGRYSSEVPEEKHEYYSDLMGMLAALGEQAGDQGVAMIDWVPLGIRLGYDALTQASPDLLVKSYWYFNIDINQPVGPWSEQWQDELTKGTVLIVATDHTEIEEDLVRLKEAGYGAVIVGSSEEAMNVLAGQAFDLAVVDDDIMVEDDEFLRSREDASFLEKKIHGTYPELPIVGMSVKAGFAETNKEGFVANVELEGGSASGLFATVIEILETEKAARAMLTDDSMPIDKRIQKVRQALNVVNGKWDEYDKLLGAGSSPWTEFNRKYDKDRSDTQWRDYFSQQVKDLIAEMKVLIGKSSSSEDADRAMRTTSFKNLPEGVQLEVLLKQMGEEKVFGVDAGYMRNRLDWDTKGYSSVMLDKENKVHAFILVEEQGDKLVVNKYGYWDSRSHKEDFLLMLLSLSERVKGKIESIDISSLDMGFQFSRAAPERIIERFPFLIKTSRLTGEKAKERREFRDKVMLSEPAQTVRNKIQTKAWDERTEITLNMIQFLAGIQPKTYPEAGKLIADELVANGIIVPVEGMDGVYKKNPFGGIDLTRKALNLQIKRDGKGIPLPIDQQPIENMNIEGFFPVIINVTPVPSLPMLIGLKDLPDDRQAPKKQARGEDSPFDRQKKFIIREEELALEG